MTTDVVLPSCPECSEPYTYEQGDLLVCPMCGYEWIAEVGGEESAETDSVVRDAVGNELADGDTVTIVKGLRFPAAAGEQLKLERR